MTVIKGLIFRLIIFLFYRDMRYERDTRYYSRLIFVNYNPPNSKWNGRLSRYKRELSARSIQRGKSTWANWSRVKSHYHADALQGWSDPRRERDTLQAPFLCFNTQLRPEGRLFRRVETTIKLYGAFNHVTANRVKIQECGILRGEDRFPIAVHGESNGVDAAKGQFPKFADAFTRRKRPSAPPCRKAKRILLLSRGFVESIKTTVSPHNPRKRPLASYNVGYYDSYIRHKLLC